MRYALIRRMDITNGEGIGISLFVQGCHFHCKGCFNEETWDFSGGKEWTQEVKDEFLKLSDNKYVTRITVLGGEPLCDENVSDVYDLCVELKHRHPDKKIWIYTGYTYEEIAKSSNISRNDILRIADVLIDGRFEYDKRDLSLKFRGSGNQRIIDLH